MRDSLAKPADIFRELRATLMLAFPIVVGQVSQILIGVTDNAFIGRAGRAELAAAASTHGVFGLCHVVGIGLVLGAGVFAARDHGAGDETGCAAWLRHGRVLAAIGVAMFGLLIAEATMVDPLARAFGLEPGIYSDAHVAAWRGGTIAARSSATAATRVRAPRLPCAAASRMPLRLA